MTTNSPRNEAPSRNEAPRRSGCGCFKGCLIVFLVGIVLVGGLTVAGLTVGRAYVTRQLPVWGDRYPVVGLAVDLLALRGMLVEEQAPAVDGSARQKGADDKALLPDDLPVYPEPLVETYSIDGQTVTVYQRADAPVDAVAATLTQSLRAQGWEEVQRRDAPDGLVAHWLKADRACIVEIVAEGDHTGIWLRTTEAQPAAP